VKRGDVVLMVVPRELGRTRPSIIVQADELGDNTTTVLICPLSSDVQANGRLRPIVEPTAANGLRIRSQIMTDKPVAERRDRVRRVIGIIDPETSERLDTALLIVLGLARSGRYASSAKSASRGLYRGAEDGCVSVRGRLCSHGQRLCDGNGAPNRTPSSCTRASARAGSDRG
jgi:mRNA interferase MazF